MILKAFFVYVFIAYSAIFKEFAGVLSGVLQCANCLKQAFLILTSLIKV